VLALSMSWENVEVVAVLTVLTAVEAGGGRFCCIQDV